MNLKRQAAQLALTYVKSGMRIGLGTGSTTTYFIHMLGEKIRSGELSDVTGVPTSIGSAQLAEELGINVTVYASFMNIRHEYDDRIVTIEFFIVSRWNSEPVGREGQALRWVRRDLLDPLELLPDRKSVV